ncbi:DEAD/DEAH box helicase [Paramicrobacterium agarici]|uniref:DEAD/DEAH box helicase n=1 Tax=Paramicrobacterium agarici TaxID=630514 RepID=UPI00114F1376|nr:DEAD/DEAH box helicase [Microbacterium agarici]TQO23416.1 superfamily II DNA/RNA helicase [Microbacterium agarici]
MPKNKKPAGGRPARNFDPDYVAKRRAQQAKKGPKPGSRSPGHRGYRAPEETPKKNRWDAAERAERAEQRRQGDRRFDRDDRPQRERFDDERPKRHYERDDRPRRQFVRDDRPRRDDRARDDRARRDDRGSRVARDDRPGRDDRRFDRDARPQRRSFDSDDRPRRSFERDSRPRRDDRSTRFNSDDRAQRRYERDDRPRRQFDRDERPQRRQFDRDDRPQRRFDRDSRPQRRDSFANRDAKPRFTPQDDVVLERLEADAIQASDVEGVSFSDLGLGGNIVRTLGELGAASPFPIQAATIPDVLAGKDVLGRGRTGSGKTIAFGAPLVERLMENKGGTKREMGRKPRALILAPTRELALQIDRTVQPIARSVGLFTTQIYGGVPQARQVGALKRGVDIVIGTPGRIEDLIEQGRLDLSDVKVSVLDEADHMCDLGFLEPVQRILRQTAPKGQKLLFSATLDTGVAALVNEFLVDPAVHEVAGEDQDSGTIDHRVLVALREDKVQLLTELAGRDEKTLVFTRTRAYAEQLVDDLEDAGVRAVALHGDLSQGRRQRNLERLTSGRVKVLVATDVAARGIHVDDITLVIQADMPDEYKTYLHRSGRTGRAGKAGRVVTVIPRNRRRRMSEMLERAEIDAPIVDVFPGDDVVDEIAGRPTIADLTS